MTQQNSPQIPANSPLKVVSEQTLGELFAADPESLTDDDVEKMVDGLIAHRQFWAAQEAEAKVTGKRPKAKKIPKVDVSKLELDL